MQTQDVSQKNQLCQLTIKICLIMSILVEYANIKKKKDKMKCEKELFFKDKLDGILENLNVKQKRLNEMAREKGVSNWLNAYPLKIYGFDVNKQQFWDGITIRYG